MELLACRFAPSQFLRHRRRQGARHLLPHLHLQVLLEVPRGLVEDQAFRGGPAQAQVLFLLGSQDLPQLLAASGKTGAKGSPGQQAAGATGGAVGG